MGRKKLLVTAQIAYIAVCIGAGFVRTIQELIVVRLLMAGTVCSAIVIGAGCIADVYQLHERGQAMGFFSVTALLGPVLGPILGGVIAGNLGWRAIFWFLAIACSVVVLFVALFLPETMDPSRRKRALPNIFKPLLFLKDFRVAASAIHAALIFSTFFCAEYAGSQILETKFALSSQIVGVCMLPLGVGTVIGTITGGRLVDRGRRKYGKSGSLLPSLIAGSIFPIIAIIFGYTYSSHISVLLVLMFFIGLFCTMSRPGTSTYVMEVVPKSSSGGKN